MKSWNDSRSPWGKQLRFDDHEFESMMDTIRGRAGSDCFSSGSGIDVDLVLLRAENVEADYMELPEGILGRTIFAPNGEVRVEISRALCEMADGDHIARRRLRTTIAHECGHIACHRGLFVQDTHSYSLFAESEMATSPHAKQPILCRSEGIGGASYGGEWWEYQANQCMASLLLPTKMVADFVRKLLADGGYKSGEECLARGGGELLVHELSDEYDVSQTVALYRLQRLGFLPKDSQMLIRFAD